MTGTVTQMFGLFELDTTGTIMYSRIEPSHPNNSATNTLIGRNFFDEIAPSDHSAEIQRRFRYFAKSSLPADKFTLTYLYEQKSVEVRVMLTQISQREYDAKEKMIIVDIRKI